MNAETISMFIKFKRGKAGTVLLDSNNQQVYDVNENVVVCQGGWNDPNNGISCAPPEVRDLNIQRGALPGPQRLLYLLYRLILILFCLSTYIFFVLLFCSFVLSLL
jgi:hypothetical protein